MYLKSIFYPYLQALRINTSSPPPPHTQRPCSNAGVPWPIPLKSDWEPLSILQGETSLWKRWELNPVSLPLLTVCDHFLSWCASEHECWDKWSYSMLLHVRRISSLNFLWYYVLLSHHLPNHSPLSQSECLQRAVQNDLIPVLAVTHN